jgi:hypothetical protein
MAFKWFQYENAAILSGWFGVAMISPILGNHHMSQVSGLRTGSAGNLQRMCAFDWYNPCFPDQWKVGSSEKIAFGSNSELIMSSLLRSIESIESMGQRNNSPSAPVRDLVSYWLLACLAVSLFRSILCLRRLVALWWLPTLSFCIWYAEQCNAQY